MDVKVEIFAVDVGRNQKRASQPFIQVKLLVLSDPHPGVPAAGIPPSAEEVGSAYC